MTKKSQVRIEEVRVPVDCSLWPNVVWLKMYRLMPGSFQVLARSLFGWN